MKGQGECNQPAGLRRGETLSHFWLESRERGSVSLHQTKVGIYSAVIVCVLWDSGSVVRLWWRY